MIQYEIVDSSHKEEIVALRNFCYAKRFSVSLSPEGLSWNKKDESARHHVFKVDGKIISVLREFFVDNENDLRDLTLSNETYNLNFLPSVFLFRACTDPEYSGMNLNLLLRLNVFEDLKLRRDKVKFVLGLISSDAIRSAFLKSIGYFVKPHLSNQEENFFLRKPLNLFYLDVESKIDFAILKLKELKNIKHGI